MQDLNFPEYQFRYKKEGENLLIFDSIRKKHVVLTPEEWVRQNMVQFLIHEKNVPSSLIHIEMSLKYNTLKKRSDIVIFNNLGKPLLIVECKSPNIAVTQNVFDQIARYNFTLKVNFLIVTNGIDHFCCKIDFENNNYSFLTEVPNYQDLIE
ncbi:MAG: type I restriction enzyme HsdR N-terminal domain-containing protein [Bacteroidetes bacterium]|nr:type I restriction enzyme HsdR N-terminal domain-containing protein [Bacteroidota bacterium]